MNIEDVSLSHIYDFMETGNPQKAPAEIVSYLEMLDKIRSMKLRIDKFSSKDAIIKHLILVDKLSRYKATQLYDETIEYFYSEVNISKKAWRNLYAEQMEKVISFALQTMKDVNDASKVAKMITETAELRGVNEPDKEELPDEIFQPPFVIYTSDAEQAGLPKVDRNRLKQLIEKFPELSEKEKIQIQREAQVLPLKIFPDEHEDARK